MLNLNLFTSSNRKGFTLVEMAIIMVIIGLIAGMILPAIIKSIKREQITDARRQVRMARDEIIGYAMANNKLPADLSKIAHGDDPFPTGSYPYLFYRPADEINEGKSGSGQICDVGGTTLKVTIGSDTYDDIAFVIASKGKNMNFQLNNATNGTVTLYESGQPNIDGYPGDMNRPEEYDDIAEFVTLDYLKQKVCTPAAQAPTGSDVSFAMNMADFPQEIANAINPNTIVTVDMDAKEIKISQNPGAGGKDNFGCVWYMGNETEGNCTNGECSLGNGIRAYFQYQVSAGSDGGFTFAIVNASNGNTACGDKCGELGYAGGTLTKTPKLGIEIDVSGEQANYDPPGSWTASDPTNSTGNDFGIVWTDTKHKAANYIGNPPSVYNATNDYAWLESDLITRNFRVEIEYNSTIKSYTVCAWYDCTGDDCDDLTRSLCNATDYTPDVRDSGSQFTPTSKIRFGWTSGSCENAPLDVIIKNFGLRFIRGNM